MILPLVLAAASVVTPLDVAPADALPERWVMGDWGVPVEYQDHTLWFYADPLTNDGQIARSLMTVNGLEFIHPIATTGDTFYWVTDATELPDGSLLVAALEVETPEIRHNDGWDFAVVDTDLFVVPDALSPASWRVASTLGKVESGWWHDGDSVEFSDQYDGLAFTSNAYFDIRNVVTFDPADPAAGDVIAQTPRSDGPFAPVNTDDGWVGISWDYDANTSTVCRAPDLTSPWECDEPVDYHHGQTHAHGLNVIDGEVWHRYSTIRQRPSYGPYVALLQRDAHTE